MSIRVVEGDLIKMAQAGHFDVIAHGANCFHTMGSGIAPLMNKLTNGELLRADKQTPYGDINKMGSTSHVVTTLEIPFSFTQGQQNRYPKDLYVFNLYTQYVFGDRPNGEVYVHWDSFLWSMLHMIDTFEDPYPLQFGIPLIGCGLAGGKEEDFFKTLEEVDQDLFNITVVRFSK